MNEEITLKRWGNIYGDFGTGFAGNVWDSDGLCPTIKCESGGGNRVQMILIEEDDEQNNMQKTRKPI